MINTIASIWGENMLQTLILSLDIIPAYFSAKWRLFFIYITNHFRITRPKGGRGSLNRNSEGMEGT